MHALIFVNRGFEELIVQENLEKIIIIENFEGAVIAEFDSIRAISSYIYTTQLANSVSLLLDRKKNISEIKLDESANQLLESLIPKQSSFRITSKIGEEDIIGELFKGRKVDLKNPGFIIGLYELDKEYFLTLELSGELSKRDYKVFNNPLSIKGTTAFGVLILSGYKRGKSLLDPFCNSGIIAIESVLYNNSYPVKFYSKDFLFTKLNIEYEKIFAEIDNKIRSKKIDITAADPLLRNVTAAKKNAKIAGIEKSMEFRRIDIDWMDIKNEEKTFDFIVTFIPGSSKHRTANHLKKDFEQFFYQAEYIIKKDGVISVLCLSKDLLIESSNKYLVLKETKDIYSGTQLMHILIFGKRKK